MRLDKQGWGQMVPEVLAGLPAGVDGLHARRLG